MKNIDERGLFCAYEDGKALTFDEFMKYLLPMADESQFQSLKKHYSEAQNLGIFIINKKSLVLKLEKETLELDFEGALRQKHDILRKEKRSDQLLYKALGLGKGKISSSPWIYDATAGLGEDLSWFMALGFHIRAAERNPLMFCLLSHALKKMGQIGEQQVELCFGDSALLIDTQSERDYHAIYFDPFFQKKRKAKTKKSMEIISTAFHEDDLDATHVAASLFDKCRSRLVIKRSDKAPLLLPAPTYEIKGKTVRFDIYYRG